jgi:subtilisin family serine protease
MKKVFVAMAGVVILILSVVVNEHFSFGQELSTSQQRGKATHPKLESSLYVMLQSYRSKGLAGAAENAAKLNIPLKDEYVQIILQTTNDNISSIEPTVHGLGGSIEAKYGTLLQASLPLSALEAVASIDTIDLVRRPFIAGLTVTSEGVTKIGAANWQAAGYDGTGIKVAVVDLGFAGYASRLGTELPSSVVVRSFRADGDITGGGEQHGTACAETVHDVAPGASLFLVNFSTEVELGNALDWLITQGVTVISFSIGYLNTAGPGDGTGIIADIIAKARSKGILWVGSAGNYAQRHWLGNWNNPDGDEWHNFSGDDETETISAVAGSTIVIGLRWNDLWEASANDYDLYLYDSSITTVLASSINSQFGFQNPTETIVFTAPYTGTYHIAIKRFCFLICPDPVEFDLMTFNQNLQYQVAARSLAIGPDSADALAVGATYVFNDGLESFSSQGPTTDARIKPDLTGPDGTSNSIYGAFFGTSAAAPHAAGAAALVISAFPAFTQDDVRDFLINSAVDLGSPGKDNLYGSGRVDLGGSPISRTLTVASQNPSSGVPVTVSPNDNNTQGNGTTQFTRIYNNNAAVTLIAPLVAGSNNFSSWSGCNIASGTTCNVTMSADRTVTAIYVTPAPITLILPNGGEVWRIGTTQTVRWTSNGVNGNVRIDLFRNGVWKTIIKKTANDGLQSWKVTKPASSQAKIRICSVSSPTVCDASDNNLTIQ